MKQFIIIGCINAITYKDVFPKIIDNEINIGYSHPRKWTNGKKMGNIYWYTSMPVKDKQPLILTKTYNEEDYPKYDNYDAIEVSKYKDIPIDYNGVMGVPITFMDRYCDSQFKILGIANCDRWYGEYPCYTMINGKNKYQRILIKKIMS